MWTGSWGEMLAASLLATAAAAILLVALRGSLAGPWWLLLGCAPLLVWLKDDLRVFSYHGLMHTSIVIQLLQGNVPPLDPFMAGDSLKYAWGHHALVALPCWLFGWSPPTGFAVVSTVLLAATLWILHRAASLLVPGRSARVLATVLSLCGVTLFSRGPLWELVVSLGLTSVNRILPIEKFVHVNNNAAGVLFFALHLWAMMELFVPREARRPRAYALLFLSVLGSAVFYPLSWMPLVASTASCGAVYLLTGGRGAWKPTVGAAAAVVAGTAVALPYLLQIMLGRDAGASFGPTLAWPYVAWKGKTVAVSLIGVAMLLAVERRQFSERWRAVPDRVRLLLVSAGVNLALYLGVHVPYHSEYKFLLVASLTLGLLAGPLLDALSRRHAVVGAVALVLALLPAASHWLELLQGTFGDTRRVTSTEGVLRQTDGADDALNQWVRRETPPEAVFVDWDLSLPPFAHRRAFTLLDRPFVPHADPGSLYGWTMGPSQFLHNLFGHGVDAIRRRYELTTMLLVPGTADPSNADLDELRALAGTPAVYVVVRDVRRQKSWDADRRFERSFSAWRTRVFRVVGPP